MIGWLLGKMSGKFMVYALISLFATSLLAIGTTQFYRTKAKAVMAECNLEIERSAREAKEEVIKALQEAYDRQIKDAEDRVELERKAAEKDKEIIAKITNQKIQLERKLQDALNDKDTRAWADLEFPSSLCESTPHCNKARDSEDTSS